MAAGDVYTQTGGTPPVAWVDPATAIAANGRVLASVTSGGGKIPQWMSASAAIAGGNNVYTVFFDTALAHNRPAWLPLSAPGCFGSGATLTLVAGGINPGGASTDGPLGTNATSNPWALAINPVDGLAYFVDNSFLLRTLDPASSYDMATSIYQSPLDAPDAAVNGYGLAITPDGTIYQWGIDDNDSPFARFLKNNSDGTVDHLFDLSGGNVPVWLSGSSTNAGNRNVAGDLAVSPDGTRIYFCLPYAPTNALSTDGGQSLIAWWDVSGAQANYLSGILNGGSGDRTAYPSPTDGSGTAPAGTGATDQGEGATSGDQFLVGNVTGLCVDSAGNVYSVANDVNLIRKTKADGSQVDSLADHGVIVFSGGAPEWPVTFGNSFAGDGTPAYSGESSSARDLMTSATGICLTDCGGVLVVDRDNQAIRHIDPAGLLTTVAGDPTLSGMPYPTSTPSDALSCQIHPNKIIQLGGGKYLITQSGNGSTVPDAIYLLQG